MNTDFRIRRISPLAVAAIAFAGACAVSVAWGATYNFYFNNTEQGPNSTATPHLTVSQSADGKIEKKEGGQTLTPMGEKPADAAAAGAAPAANQSGASASSFEPK